MISRFEPVHACECGQTTITPTGRCDACEKAAHEPQGTQDRLFQPPAEQMRGQTTMTGLDAG